MTKKFFAAMAMATAFMMTGAMVAQAADVTFGGQIRLRGEAWTAPSFSNDNFSSFIGNRVRLNANVKVSDDLSAFIQLQNNSRFGSFSNAGGGTVPGESQALSCTGAGCGVAVYTISAGNAASTVGGGGGAQAGHNPGAANDLSNGVGLHQAYFVQKNLFGLPVALKAGRQEVVLDGHRLFGHTGWTTGAQSHDAVALTHAAGNHTISFIYSKAFENAARGDGGNFAGTSVDDSTDRDVYVLYGNMKGLLGAKSSTSLYLVLDDNDTATAADGMSISADVYTFGARQAGTAAGIDYRVEAYLQQGKTALLNTTMVVPEYGDRGGYMLGARIGKKFGSVPMKPKFTLWADYLSGSDLNDLAAGDMNSFNTLFDTGHKFYGYMDMFLGEQTFGLIDLAAKMAVSPMAKTTVKVDYHHFQQAEETPGTLSSTIGQEVDLTVVYKYSSNMKFVAGYSRFFARDNAVGGPGSTASNTNYDDAQWAYLMMDMAF